MIEPTPEQIEREFIMWRDSEVDRTGTLPTGYEMFRAAYELAASAVNGRHDHIEDGSSYLDCIACVAATSRSRPTRMADVVIVDMLTAFYGAERDGWSTKKVARMRAALVAAAGATPQEPAAGDQEEIIAEAGKHSKGEPQHCDCGRPGCDGQAYCTWCGNEWPCLSRRLADALAAPPQVDEAKLADVIWGEQESRVLDGYVIHTRETAATTARTVAEWLRGGQQ